MKTIVFALIRGSLQIVNRIMLPFRSRIIAIMPQFKKHNGIPFDYIRYATFQLLLNEIKEKKLTGDVAELGVYRGDFAQYINKAFPERTLYLFDTFEGFDKRDVARDRENSYSDGKQDFSKTNENIVMKKMIHPKKCVIVKGYFPESLNNVTDNEKLQFSFVSLDADLYEPIYRGLVYFYPKLCKGGYILIHDYNSFNDIYKGVKQALYQFCNERAISYVPIPDSGGSVVITKS